MLKQLKRFLSLEDGQRAVSPEPKPGAISVTFDNGDITIHQRDGQRGSMPWDILGSVTVAVTADIDETVFWLLLSRDRSQYMAVPVEAVGARELLMAMQLRLRDFDNDAVISAMTSTETEHFVVWQAPLAH